MLGKLLERAGYERCKGLMMSSEAQWRVQKWAAVPTNDHLSLSLWE